MLLHKELTASFPVRDVNPPFFFFFSSPPLTPPKNRGTIIAFMSVRNVCYNPRLNGDFSTRGVDSSTHLAQCHPLTLSLK